MLVITSDLSLFAVKTEEDGEDEQLIFANNDTIMSEMNAMTRELYEDIKEGESEGWTNRWERISLSSQYSFHCSLLTK